MGLLTIRAPNTSISLQKEKEIRNEKEIYNAFSSIPISSK